MSLNFKILLFGSALFSFVLFNSLSASTPVETLGTDLVLNHGSSCIFNGMIYAYCIYPTADNKGWTTHVKTSPATGADAGIVWIDQGELRINGSPGFLGPDPLAFDHDWASFPGVFVKDNRIHLVYEAQNANPSTYINGNPPDQIGYAYSDNGIDFVKPFSEPLLSQPPDGNGFGTPQLFYKGNKWYLTYSMMEKDNFETFHICLATSSTLEPGAFEKYPGNPVYESILGNWDEATAGHRNIVYRNGLWYMVVEGATLQDGHPFDHWKNWGWSVASSNDLIHWNRYVNPTNPDSRLGVSTLYNMGEDGPMIVTANNIDYSYHRSNTWTNSFETGLRSERTEMNWNNFNFDFEVEGSSAGHYFGHAYTNRMSSVETISGWYVSKGEAPANESMMIYGPNTTSIPAGENVATFRIMRAPENSDPVDFAKVEIVQDGATVLASRYLNNSEFPINANYYAYKIPFTNPNPSKPIQFRFYTVKNTYAIYVDNITSTNVMHQTFEAESNVFSHDKTYQIGSGVVLASGQGAGMMQYGPYTRKIPGGTHTASFKLVLPTRPSANTDVAVIDVFTDERGVLASKTVYSDDFRRTNEGQYFDLTFNSIVNSVISPGDNLQFRVYFTGKVPSFAIDKVIVFNAEGRAETQPQTLYNGPHNISNGATLQAEDFDNGGEGVAYHDNDATNSGGVYRTNVGVDIGNGTAGVTNVGYTAAGEWMEYTCNVTAGIYDITLYAASPNSNTPDGHPQEVKLYQGNTLKATFTIPNTGGWQYYRPFTVHGVPLTANTTASVLKLESTTGGYDLDKLTFALVGTQTPFNYKNRPHRVCSGATLQAEDFDNGGQGISYNDDGGNTGGAYRTDVGVDIQQGTPEIINVGWTNAGEWMKYTCAVTGGTYNITLFAASQNSGTMKVNLYQDDILKATFTVPNTGGWQNYVPITFSGVVLTANTESVLKLECVDGGFNLDKLTFACLFNGPHNISNGATLQAEDFDDGVEGIAFHELDSDSSVRAYRHVQVDIVYDPAGVAPTGVGYTVAGEWMQYTCNVTAGTYNITLYASSVYDKTADGLHPLIATLYQDGTPKATFTVKHTTGWYDYQPITISGVSLTAGSASVLRLESTTDRYNLDKLTFTTGPVQYTITASAGANGTISPSGSVKVNSGANQTFTITPNSGYVVSAVTVDGTSMGTINSYQFTGVTANHTISATFAATTQYTITASAGANGSISPSGSVKVNSGASQTFTITPNSGYVVSAVMVDGTSKGAINSYPFTGVTANHTISATFATSTFPDPTKWYKIATKANANQCLDVTGGSYANGTAIELWTKSNINQEFKFQSAGSGYYTITCRSNTNYSIDMGGTFANNQTLKLWTTQTTNANQKFKLVPITGGYYRIESSNSGYSIDNSGNTGNGIKPYLWTSDNNNSNQQWVITLVP